MAAYAEDDVEYESDPEEAKRALTVRRREASDDEDEDRERTVGSRDRIGSEGESEGQGAAEEYDYEEEEELEEYHELDNEEEEIEAGELGGEGVVEVADEGLRSVGLAGAEAEAEGEARVGDEGKKENEPFAVPTAGAFYMHDDRFRDNARGRNRRMFGGKKLWETQDDRKWGHDKFEEMTLQERHYNEGTRNFRGRYRGQGKNRGGDHGNPRGDKAKVYDTYNQNQAPKITKGRGFKKYDSLKRNKNEAPPMQYRKRPSKAAENPPHAATERAPTESSDLESGPVSYTKQSFASSLNSASPPFYPSGSSSKETTWIQKRDAPTANVRWNARSADVDENISVSQLNATRVRNGVDSVGMSELRINDSVSSNAGSLSTGSLMVHSAHSRGQGKGVSSPGHKSLHPAAPHNQVMRASTPSVASPGQMSFQPVAPHNQVMRASTPSHFHTMQRNPIQSGGQSSPQSSSHQSRQFSVSRSQISSPAGEALNPFEHGESDYPSESTKLKSAVVAKEKGSVQGSKNGSFMYAGSQVRAVSGNTSSGHDDQNFTAAPAFLPVMPFGGQHPGGIGVPAVGMAFPGYVSQPNGLGNSEMTWLPVLAGAAGGLGSAYGSPYIALESAHHSRQSGKTSSSGASIKESNANKSNNEWKPSQTPEVTSDEVGQRQRYTRRYTEMKFGQ